MGWEIVTGDWGGIAGQAGAWALVLARTLGLCLTAPVLAVPELDWRFRLALAGFLGAVLAPVVGSWVVPPATASWSVVAWAGLSELLTGGFIGWTAALVVAGARAAGDLVAAQAGLATATLIDPESGETLNPLGRLYGLIALAVFLALNGPILLVRALVESYQAVPAGRMMLSLETATTAFAQVGRVFELALCAAAPPPWRWPWPASPSAGSAAPRRAPLHRTGTATAKPDRHRACAFKHSRTRRNIRRGLERALADVTVQRNGSGCQEIRRRSPANLQRGDACFRFQIQIQFRI